MLKHNAVPGIILFVSFACSTRGYGCPLEFTKPATTIVLLDRSKTVKDYGAFRKAWNEVVDSAKDGDTVMLVVVKGDSRDGQSGEFPYRERVTMPCYSILGTWNKYVAAREAARKRLIEAFGSALQSEIGRA